MFADLIFILVLRVNDDFGDEVKEDVFEELGGHMECSPVVTFFQYFQDVTYKKNRVSV